VPQGVDEHVRRILGAGTKVEDGNDLREGVDGQPQPPYVCGAAQPGAQFVQLEVREPEIARCERSCKVCAYKGCASQKGWRWWPDGSRRPVLRRKGPALRLAQTAPSRFGERGFSNGTRECGVVQRKWCGRPDSERSGSARHGHACHPQRGA
jgi:hypothetical protein